MCVDTTWQLFGLFFNYREGVKALVLLVRWRSEVGLKWDIKSPAKRCFQAGSLMQ
jgi:hypothetical protein